MDAQHAFGTISQRFAIDYVKVDEFGRSSVADPSIPGNYFGFGEDVLAVADGVVVSAHDGAPDDGIGGSLALALARALPGRVERPEPLGGAPATLGNYVDLEIGDGIYALYMHLRSGSVTVQAGDSVRLGQVIGQLGTSGASAYPHLHLQLDESSWKEGREAVYHLGEGLPYEISSFDVVGQGFSPYCRCAGDDCPLVGIESHDRALVSGGMVVRFPAGVEQTDRDIDHVTAVCRLRRAVILAEQYQIARAIETIAEARALDAGIVVPGNVWGELCWRGSIAGQAASVLDACEMAVAEAPDYGPHLTARGMARALSGKAPEAIADLEAYLEWQAENELSALAAARSSWPFQSARRRALFRNAESIEDLRAQVQGFIDALRSGANPFTPELLEDLRGN